MTTISIHQPGYHPWLGFFKKIMSCDLFVFLDDVQYEKNGWHNRNKIKTSYTDMWLTVPVKSSYGTNLNEIKIDNSNNWIQKHKKSIQLNYAKTPYFQKFWEFFDLIYEKKYELLIDVNIDVINSILKILKINTKTIFSSDLNISQTKSDRILEICKTLGADKYLSGSLGKGYLKSEDFSKSKIEILFQNFNHPIYTQIYPPFLPNMATIDLIFNEGEKSKEILNSAKNF